MIGYRISKKEQDQPDSHNPKITGRKDWGYTNHYRRMMMQRSPLKAEEGEPKK